MTARGAASRTRTFDIEALRKAGALSALDVELARSLARQLDEVALVVSLVSRHTRAGHVRLDLASVAGRPIPGPDAEPLEEQRVPKLAALRKSLSKSALLTRPGHQGPLVLADDRYLYLARYFDHERALARGLLQRADRALAPADAARARADLLRAFGPPSAGLDLQRVAAAVATVRGLCVISGGPGTGKTTTVVKILAVVLGQLIARGHHRPRAILLAPTGKAARRLTEAVSGVARSIDVDEPVRDLLPTQASTIHRALARTPTAGRRTSRFAAEVVVVDEASMVDVALMRRLVEATRPDARLILLGDPDQLASVEAGAVLADICNDTRNTQLGSAVTQDIEAVFGESLSALGPDARAPTGAPALSNAVVQLEKSHRFGKETTIGRLAAAIRAGDAEASLAVLSASDTAAAHHALPPDKTLGPALERSLVSGFRAALTAPTPDRALEALGRYRVLCAHRRGPASVETVNAFAERRLAAAGLLQPRGAFYHGRHVLVTNNDASVELFNGDIGVVWRRDSGGTVVLFPGPGGEVRAISPARLPPHETAFAMSIHKSQGSELDAATIVLPDASSPLLSRELLYTAVTRARKQVAVFGTTAAIEACVGRRVRRDSGLRDLLYGRGQ